MYENSNTLSMISWNNPSDNLVLLIFTNNMQKTAVLECIRKFIESNAFYYTLINNEMAYRISDSIAGTGKGKEKTTIKMLGHKS